MPWQSDALATDQLSDYGLTDQGAFPIVHPVKSALYFDSVRGFGEWRILISSRADKMLRKARRADKRTFEIMIKKIKELSRGYFSADNHKRLNGCSADIPIFEAKMTRDLRLVYQIDCAPEYDSDGETQIIKIYGIYTHAQLDGRFWDSVSHQLARQGKEYRDRCNMRERSRRAGQDAILPCSFPPRVESALMDVPHNSLELTAGAWEDIHTLLHLDKYVTLSQALLFSMLADLDVQHVFSVSLREKEIIEHPYSCYVLGRSGTGKTTTMLFKMLGIERAWELRAEEVPKVRQLFVTKSRILVEKVEEYFVKLMASLSTGSKSPEELKELAKAQKLTQKREVMVDKDEEVDYQSDLPARFSLLTENHFPLFITFDQLCKLLEADIGEDAIRSHKSRNFVTAKVFLRSYWPHFPQTLTKGLDSSMVFSEFIGVIKGSERALDYEHGFVDQNGYENLSSRTQPAFAHTRVPLYQLFQAYLKLKRQRGDYDTADRTHALIQSLENGGFSGQEVDFLYVDEAQDNLLIDATILRALCKNPHGLFWAGDTAQTISVGSSFRFDDLKAFLFRIEVRAIHLAVHKQTFCERAIGPGIVAESEYPFRSSSAGNRRDSLNFRDDGLGPWKDWRLRYP